MFRFGLLHAFPSTPDGGTFQTSLQHLRKLGRLHNGFLRALVRRRTLFGAPGPHPISGLQRNRETRIALRATFPLQDRGHAREPHDPRRRILRDQVSDFTRLSRNLRFNFFMSVSFSFTGGFSKAATWLPDTTFSVAWSTFPTTPFESTNPSKENSP